MVTAMARPTDLLTSATAFADPTTALFAAATVVVFRRH